MRDSIRIPDRRRAALTACTTALLTFVAGLGLAQPLDPEAFVADPVVLPADPAPVLAGTEAIVSGAVSLPAAVEAGHTPGSLQVTSTGAAGYSLPLWTPPGVGEVDLRLSLQYNSRGANGVLGQGWSLAGLSVIHTCNRTLAQDGAPGPAFDGRTSRLCLDGQQLKLVSGSYGATGAIYATEIESFARVAQVSTGLVPAFVLTTRDGLVYEYGTTPDSQIQPQRGSRQAWALSRIRDRQSPTPNQILITYQNDSPLDPYGNGSNIGSYRVARIAYPVTATGQGPFYQVDFTYSPRPTADAHVGFVDGTAIREPNELDSISIRSYGASAVIRSYNFAYDASPATGRLRLASVTECAAASCLTPTRFTYLGGSNAYAAMQKANFNASTAALPLPIDINGDGLQDLLLPKANGGSNTRWWAALGTPTGLAAAVDTGLMTANASRLLVGSFTGRPGQQWLMAQGGTWLLASMSGSTFTATNTGVAVNGEFGAVDWDGDGLPDLVSVVGTELRVRRNTTVPPGNVTFEAATQLAATSIGGFPSYNATSSTSLADFNGDGRGDVVATGFDLASGYTTLVLMSNGFGAAPTVGTPGEFVDVSRLADFNADGCTDIVTPATVFLSACDGSFRRVSAGPAPSIPGAQLVADMDGDGRSDLLYIHTTQKQWYVLRSRGDGYAAPLSLGLKAPDGTAWFVLDANGDGLGDLGYRDDTNGGAVKYHLHDATAAPADALAVATDGLGVGQSVRYAVITQSNHTRRSDAAFPEIDVQLPMHVVSQLDANVGTGSTYRLQYHYFGARMHLQGRGFEGFGSVRTLDSRTGLYRMDTLQQRFPHTGMLTQSTLLQGNLATRVHDFVATPAVQTFGSTPFQQRYFPFVQSSTESQYEFGGPLNGTLVTQASATFAYGDGYGNLTATTRTVTDKDPGSPYFNASWQSSTSASYFNDATANCYGLPASTTTTRSAPGQPPKTRTIAYQADTQRCRLTQQVVEPSRPELRLASTLGYDACGNASSFQVNGANWDGAALPARTTRVDYGARCQLPERLTNPLGETSLLSYRYDLGAPASRTDANGVTTRWTYDAFGRRRDETRPDGTRTAWSYSNCSPGTCQGSIDLRLRTTIVATGTQGEEYERRNLYLDGTGRLQYQSVVLPLGATSTERFVHDALGRLVARYVPKTGVASNGYETLSYDPLGRVLAERLYTASGALERNTTFAYAGRQVSITDPLGRIRSILRDVTGQTRQVVDPWPGGVTSYEYDAFGDLVQVRDAGGAVSSGSRDGRGQLTAWTDADAGAWTYRRDSFGQLVRWTDAKGQSFSATYDALGRMVSRTEPEGTSTWSWGSSAALHNVGALQRAASAGYAEDYAYDGLGRLARRTITADQAYSYDYAYGSDGSLATLSYPTSPVPAGQSAARFKVRYARSQGAVVGIFDASEPAERPLWSLGATNDTGLASSESLAGSTLAVTTSYRPWTNQPLSIQVGRSPSLTDRQNLGFEFDAAGNLSQRTDVGRSVTETFAYDALDRLSSSRLNGVANLGMTYDAAGNIVSKSDVGSYTYADAAHPHAATAAGPHTYTYDANGNQRTRDGVVQAWASFNLPTTVTQTVNGTAWQAQFSYGPTHQRWKQVANYANGVETTLYLGGLLERESTTSTGRTYWRHYVETPSGFVVVSRNSDGSTGTSYAVADHLGSPGIVLSGNGDVLARESFAPFGARRGSDWTAATPPDWAAIANTSRHGYTGHEHLDNVHLVHMGGRVYDPALGRFLSADPLIGDGLNSQSLNPYAYVGNRPLNAVDPSGYSLAPIAGSQGGGMVQNPIWVAIELILSHYLFGSSSPSYPPAMSLPGVSVQNGTQVCAGGARSASCSGHVISETGAVAGRASGPAWQEEAAIEEAARERENRVRLVIDLGRNAVNEIILAPVNDARQAHDALEKDSYGLAVLYTVFTLCDVGCRHLSIALKPIRRASTAADAAVHSADGLPKELARVVAGRRKVTTLGRPDQPDVFVTAADDITGLNAEELAKRLAVDPAGEFTVIRFPAPETGIASPVFRTNPGFIPGGMTRGGAREFVIPNGPIPANAKIEVVGP